MQIPSKARAVIIGGGVIGCSIAYHLGKLGWKDVVLLERKQLTCGTTWHAAGLIAQLRATQNMTRLAKYSQELYFGLEAETGVATGFKRNGSITVALTDERMEELRRSAAMARAFGVEIDEITPDDIAGRYPGLATGDVVGGVWLPKDGQADPVNITQALAKGARNFGASILQGVKVTAIQQANGRVTGVETDHGPIAADYVVNAGGMWGREIGAMADVAVPLHACEHFYIVTEAMPDLAANLPVLRVPDECAYYKEDAGKILLGAFEPNSKPWGMNGIPEDFEFDSLPEDFDHFEPILERAVERFPLLASAGIQTFFNGPESFTPDDRYILGEHPSLIIFMSLPDLTQLAFNRLVVRVWFLPIGWIGGGSQLTFGMLISGGCSHFRPIAAICRHAYQKRLGCFMPIISPIANLRRRVAFGDLQFIAILRLKARVLARLPDGNAPIGFCRNPKRKRAKKPNMNIAGVGRTGLTIARLNIWRFGKRWGCLTCPALARSN